MRSQEGMEVQPGLMPRGLMFRRDFWKKPEGLAVAKLAVTGGHPQRGGVGGEGMGVRPRGRAETIREGGSSLGECRRKGQGGETETAELRSRELL